MIITSEKKTVRRLGDLMLESGLISTKQLEEALEAQKTTKKRIGDVLVEKGFISERQLVSVLEYHFHVPFVDLTETAVQEAAVNLVNENLAKRSRLIPFAIEDGVLSVAMADPLDLGAIEEVRRASGQDIKVHISLSKDIQVAIDRHYGKESAERRFRNSTATSPWMTSPAWKRSWPTMSATRRLCARQFHDTARHTPVCFRYPYRAHGRQNPCPLPRGR